MGTTANTPPAATKRPLTPRERAERTLGHAAVEGGLERVFEIWPEAHIRITHDLPDGDDVNERGERYPTWSTHRSTAVGIWPSIEHAEAGPPTVMGHVRCHPPDQYDRVEGNRLAFIDALLKLNDWKVKRDWEQQMSVQSPMEQVGEIDGQPVYRTGDHHVLKNALLIWDPEAKEHRAVEIAATSVF